jgi:hypothetical protein
MGRIDPGTGKPYQMSPQRSRRLGRRNISRRQAAKAKRIKRRRRWGRSSWTDIFDREGTEPDRLY